jgi:hypothetical protein
VRSSNFIGYFMPSNLGGFYGQVMYALAEQPENCPSASAARVANTQAYCELEEQDVEG